MRSAELIAAGPVGGCGIQWASPRALPTTCTQFPAGVADGMCAVCVERMQQGKGHELACVIPLRRSGDIWLPRNIGHIQPREVKEVRGGINAEENHVQFMPFDGVSHACRRATSRGSVSCICAQPTTCFGSVPCVCMVCTKDLFHDETSTALAFVHFTTP